jgi:hypothetical protein
MGTPRVTRKAERIQDSGTICYRDRSSFTIILQKRRKNITPALGFHPRFTGHIAQLAMHISQSRPLYVRRARAHLCRVARPIQADEDEGGASQRVVVVLDGNVGLEQKPLYEALLIRWGGYVSRRAPLSYAPKGASMCDGW